MDSRPSFSMEDRVSPAFSALDSRPAFSTADRTPFFSMFWKKEEEEAGKKKKEMGWDGEREERG